MQVPQVRLSVNALLWAVAMIAVAMGSYLAGRRAGYSEALTAPPNFARDRAYLFGSFNSTRSRLEHMAIYGAAKQVEASSPGFLGRRPRVTSIPVGADAYTARQWAVTFNDRTSKAPVSLRVEVDATAEADYNAAEAAARGY